MPFLTNAWTMAGWASELVQGEMLARTLLSEPVVMYRNAEGEPRALHDRCPHRFAPLSTGKLKEGGNAIQCGYHGLEFGEGGRCTLNPHGDGTIPKAAVVKDYPLAEKWTALWIWMGDKDKADELLIPDYSYLDPEVSAVGTGYLDILAPYELEIDNILDLSHSDYLHPTLGNSNAGTNKVECIQEGDVVWSKNNISNEDKPSPLVRQSFNVPEGDVDRWMDIRWIAPGNMAIFLGGHPTGSPEKAVRMPSLHCFTPEDETKTHYFYATAVSRQMGPHAQAVVDEITKAVRVPFEMEDKPMLESVAIRMQGEDLMSLKPVLLPGDAAGMRARRVLAQKIKEEQAES